MRALVTGARGTLGKVLCTELVTHGHEVQTWARDEVPIDDYWTMERFVREAAPDVLFHLAVASTPTGRDNESWLVNYTWPSELAWICRQLGVRLVFTSTAMVFSNEATGPFTLDSTPDASDGYGYEKRRAEHRILYEQHPEGAIVVRLGWQIGPDLLGNNMLAHLESTSRAQGHIAASRRWLPACSFIKDTARALVRLAADPPPGLYMLDANRGWSFFEIASALSRQHGGRWQIVPSEDFVFDQRLLDERVGIPSLSSRLPSLPAL